LQPYYSQDVTKTNLVLTINPHK
jgi:hypothetical protein